MQETGRQKKGSSWNGNNSKPKIHSFSDFLGKKSSSTNEGDTCLFVSVERFPCRHSEFLHLSISAIFPCLVFFTQVLPLWHEESAQLHVFLSCLFPPKREAATYCLYTPNPISSQNKVPFPSRSTMVKRLPLVKVFSFEFLELLTSLFSKATSCSLFLLFFLGFFHDTSPALTDHWVQGQSYISSETVLQSFLNGRLLMAVTHRHFFLSRELYDTSSGRRLLIHYNINLSTVQQFYSFIQHS